MRRTLIIRPEAEEDLLSARDWYEEKQTGLGDRFLIEVSKALDLVTAMPELFAVQWEDVRASQLRRFPYVIYFRVIADRIDVFAVLHAGRDRSAWQRRN